MGGAFDVAIVGAGMAGASLAYFVGQLTGGAARVLLLEAESLPGYHTTGRSAAFWLPTYGGPGVMPLTMATKPFFDTPPPGFAERPLLIRRGALHLAAPGDEAGLDRLAAEFATLDVAFDRVDQPARRFPIIDADWGRAGLFTPECYDIDVAALHAGFLGHARRAGAALRCDARVSALSATVEGWRIETTAGGFTARLVVNAAGAWGDELAGLAGARPLGLQPLRRTMVAADTDPPPPVDLPVVFDAAGSFYFKPDAGRMWLTPHDEIPDTARDVVPEEVDIAVTIARFEAASTARVVRIERRWAGLRTFAPDRLPVFGFDPDVPGLFWCVGQGGFGIQTAPAAGLLAAELLLGRPSSAVDPTPFGPERFS